MNNKLARPAWAEIDLNNLKYNIKNIRACVENDAQIAAVVKADAYGHGAVQCAEAMVECGIDIFAVSTIREAADLRAADIRVPIITLSPFDLIHADKVVEYDIIPVISTLEAAEALNEAAEELGRVRQAPARKVRCMIAVDTGMGRIGFLPDILHEKNAVAGTNCADSGFVSQVQAIRALPNIEMYGLISHFSTADEADKTFSLKQLDRLQEFIKELADAGIEVPRVSMANSAAIMELPQSHYDLVRPGIILYGCYPSPEVDKSKLDLRPVMSVKGRITHVKDVESGFSVSYGRKYISEKPARIATIGMGYADGLPRRYSAMGKVLVCGKVAPIAGNICMDQFMIDVTDVPEAEVGTEVTIIGTDGEHTILADDIAEAVGTINYEIICDFKLRLGRIYKD